MAIRKPKMKQAFMPMGEDLMGANPPPGFKRIGEGVIVRETCGAMALIMDEGADGFSVVLAENLPGEGTCRSGMRVGEAVERARSYFRKVGADDGARYFLPENGVKKKGSDAREGTKCAVCLADGACGDLEGRAYRREDGSCVYAGENSETALWFAQPKEAVGTWTE